MPRVPLQPVTETASNSRRGGGAKAEEEHAAVESDAMRKWRRDWRRIMNISVFYFDGIEPASVQTIKGHLGLLGTRFQAFFDNSVTHVITNRSTSKEYAKGDILAKAAHLGMKVWTMEKLVKFLTALLGHSPSRELNSAQCAKLSQLLRQEKLVGPSDRDPTARRDDYYYFKGPYLLVWDPSHYNRPLLHKEWERAPSPYEGDWPQFRATPIGMCPFVVDTGNSMRKRSQRTTNELSRKKRLREKMAVAAAKSAELSVSKHSAELSRPNEGIAGAVAGAGEGSQSVSPETSEHQPAEVEPTLTEGEPQVGVPAQPEPSTRGPAPAFRKYCEITASGMQRYSATSAVKSTTLGDNGNGLGAAHALASREVTNLQRKVLQPVSTQSFMAPSKAASGAAAAVASPAAPSALGTNRVKLVKKPGFCENCYERFDHFDDHVLTKKHRKYAANAQNFAALDAIIESLARPKISPA